MTGASEADERTPETLYCSFCAKSQHEVRRLVAGPMNVAICDDCVQLCAAIVISEAMGGAVSDTFWLSRTKPVDSIAIIKAVVEEIREDERLASVGRSPEGEDPAEGLHAQHEDAATAQPADAQGPVA